MDGWPRGAPLPARPVADAPRPPGEAVAKGWLIALLARTPLREAAAIPIDDLAREAPALADALVAALRDDGELERLAPGGDLEPLASRAGRLAGARDAAAAAAAVDVLRTVAWGILRGGLGVDPDPRLVSDLAERLARVAAAITAAALTGAHAGPPDEPFLLHDARAPERAPEPEPTVVPVRDPWLRPIEFALARQARTAEPFSVLLVDLDDVERLVAVRDVTAALATAVEQVERAVRDQLRGDDALVRERIGRHWIVASGFDALAGRDLAERIAAAVRTSASLDGAPLTASIGLAVAPRDGATADALVEQADAGVFAARAAGLPIL